MSYLHHRASGKKPILRVNAERTLTRIEKELAVLIDNSPNFEKMPATSDAAKLTVRNALQTIRMLYKRY